MSLSLHKAQSCAFQEIHGLKNHSTPEAAMLAFCKLNFVDGVFFLGKHDPARVNTLYSFYLFSAAVGSDYRPYGAEFAAFIEKNNFGTLIESPALINKARPPDHANQIWLWMPDRTKLLAWWKAQTSKKKE